MEDVPPPLPLSTPLLLVKPPTGLSTPAIFKALNLDARSDADPRRLLREMTDGGALRPDLVVNDLEQPAFDSLPELLALKQRLQRESGGAFSTVFMTGSGSTIVCAGSDDPPAFLSGEEYADVFVSPARLITRQEGEWYQPSGGAGGLEGSAAGMAATAGAALAA